MRNHFFTAPNFQFYCPFVPYLQKCVPWHTNFHFCCPFVPYVQKCVPWHRVSSNGFQFKVNLIANGAVKMISQPHNFPITLPHRLECLTSILVRLFPLQMLSCSVRGIFPEHIRRLLPTRFPPEHQSIWRIFPSARYWQPWLFLPPERFSMHQRHLP